MSKPTSPGTHLCAGETKSPGRLSCGQAHVRTDAILHRSTKPGRRDVAGAETRAQGRIFAQATRNPPGGCHISKLTSVRTQFCTGAPNQAAARSRPQKRGRRDAVSHRRHEIPREVVMRASPRPHGRGFAQENQTKPPGERCLVQQ